MLGTALFMFCPEQNRDELHLATNRPGSTRPPLSLLAIVDGCTYNKAHPPTAVTTVHEQRRRRGGTENPPVEVLTELIPEIPAKCFL